MARALKPAAQFLEELRRQTDTLRPVDADELRAIEDAAPPDRVRLIYEYYTDGERAERTPRPFLYLHLGMLASLLLPK